MPLPHLFICFRFLQSGLFLYFCHSLIILTFFLIKEQTRSPAHLLVLNQRCDTCRHPFPLLQQIEMCPKYKAGCISLNPYTSLARAGG